MHQPYTVTEIRDENYRTKTLVFDRPLLAAPGQFVMAWLPGVGERPFSIAGDAPLALTIVAVGPFSEALHRLDVRDRVWIRGPLGRGFVLPTAPAGQRILLVGGGYGIAPLSFLARKAMAAGCKVDVCIGARTSADVLLSRALGKAGATVVVATEDGSQGHHGLVTEIAEGVIRERTPAAVYACGPVPMLEAVEVQCGRHNLPHQLSWEARIRCGMGLCGECEIHGRGAGWLTCADGPVSFG